MLHAAAQGLMLALDNMKILWHDQRDWADSPFLHVCRHRADAGAGLQAGIIPRPWKLQ